MSIKRQNNIDEILDIENLIDKHNENKDLLVANEKEIDIFRKKNENKIKNNGSSLKKYTGKLNLLLTEHPLEEYPNEILMLKTFIDSLGDQGVTFENLFENIKNYNEETGNDDITPKKLKLKFYQMNELKRLSLETLSQIAMITGYELNIEFIPNDNSDFFESSIDIERI